MQLGDWRAVMLPRPASGDLTGWEGSLRDLVPTLQELLSLNAGFVWLSETLDLTSHQPNLGAQIPLRPHVAKTLRDLH